MVFMRYFLLYFVIAFFFRIILAIVTSSQGVGDTILMTITDPNVFLYTVILAAAVAMYSMRRSKPGERKDVPD